MAKRTAPDVSKEKNKRERKSVKFTKLKAKLKLEGPKDPNPKKTAKITYNSLLKAEDKKEIIDSIIETHQNKLVNTARQNIGSRIIQVCLKYGNLEQKKKICDELIPHFAEVMGILHAHFLCIKLFKFASNKGDIVNECTKNIIRYIKNAESVQVLEHIYCNSTTAQKKQLEESLFGIKFKLLQELSYETIEKAFAEKPLIKKQILKKWGKLSVLFIEKGLVVYTIVHKFLGNYFKFISLEKLAKYYTLLRENYPSLLSSRPGVEMAINIYLCSTPKEKKGMVKLIKDEVLQFTQHDVAYAFMVVLIRNTDDTVLLSKNILTPITVKLNEELEKQTFLRFITCIFAKNYEHYTSQIPKAEGTCKKNDMQRRNEICDIIYPLLTAYIIEKFPLTTPWQILISEVIKFEIDCNKNLFYSQWVPKLLEGTDHAIHKVYRTLKSLIKYDQKCEGAPSMSQCVSKAVEGSFEELLASPSVFIIVCIAENTKTSKMIDIAKHKAKILELADAETGKKGLQILKEIVNKQ